MNYSSALSAYQQSSARGTTPLGQVVALYDTILRDFYRAQTAFEGNNIEARVFELNHAIVVVGELQSVLDFEKGGEAARRLKSFYEVTRALILEVCVSPSAEGLKRLIEIYTPVRQAWKEISDQVPTGQVRESSEAVHVSMLPELAAPRPDEATREHQSTGMWRG